VWSQSHLEATLGSVPPNAIKEPDYKRKLELVAEAHAGMDAETVFKMLVTGLIRGGSSGRTQLEQLVNELRQATRTHPA
jgi:hypothetical protein